jgi:hypothetical protein
MRIGRHIINSYWSWSWGTTDLCGFVSRDRGLFKIRSYGSVERAKSAARVPC